MPCNNQGEGRRYTYEAELCAVINELEKRGIAQEIMTEASKNGSIDLFAFWKKHSEEDRNRLSRDLNKYSEHEKQLLREILNEKEIQEFLKADDTIAVHQDFGVIEVGNLIGVVEEDGKYYHAIQTGESKILVPVDNFIHGKNVFIIKRGGFKDWVEKIKSNKV